VGALTLRAFSSVKVDEFFDAFESSKPPEPDATGSNPWFARMWAELFNCSWTGGARSNQTSAAAVASNWTTGQ